jgi:hypothetical protein
MTEERKHKPPDGATVEFMVSELWSDMKDSQEKFDLFKKDFDKCMYVGNGKPSIMDRLKQLERLAWFFSLVSAVYVLGHLQEVVNFVTSLVRKVAGL